MSIEAIDDGLALPDVGAWCNRKYHFLGRYLDAFTTAMRDKWSEIHYLDLFAGAGFARTRQSGDLVVGSPLLAASQRFPFTGLHLCERSPANAAALRDRLKRFAPQAKARVLEGDANQLVDELTKPIPKKGALCVTFADPYGLHLDFETVRAVARLQSDLVILFADNMDALRNWAAYYYDDPNSNLDRFLGETGWREEARTKPTDQLADRLRRRYEERLRQELGYTKFASLQVQNSRDRDIYTLLYATRSPTGIKIWNNTSMIDEKGQRSLF